MGNFYFGAWRPRWFYKTFQLIDLLLDLFEGCVILDQRQGELLMPVLLNIVNILTWFVSRQAIRQLHGLVILLKIDMTFEVFDDDDEKQQQQKKTNSEIDEKASR